MSEGTKENMNQEQKDNQSGEVESLKNHIAQLMKEKENWNSNSNNATLNEKVKKEQDERNKRDSDTKALESALTFKLTASDFIKQNDSVLPKEFSDILHVASKETYDGPIQEANSIKSAMIQSFFSQQYNVDLLTDSQKVSLADYLKLTKNGKEERAKEIYENIFEPALSTMKRVKKAEELARAKLGYRAGHNGDSQYKEKLIALSKKHYLGENK